MDACPAERQGRTLNRTLATEWAYQQVVTSNDERAAAPAPWIEYYNT
ncbi:hypothetical protein BCE75_1217 [Isoptericola sp. CG 20/1183]|uniref:Uncharacterized protein n=1 Tax=Isoptericola halotolerans TaxID=300560 RepID=A0ABX5EB74_9MICO|nr:hypothetical protein BCE75_1217 [Isoptericola sp. CG 20/1183]PRZ02724.1 hypothetical protein BCL65_1186 [Isoptericola halotolerans]